MIAQHTVFKDAVAEAHTRRALPLNPDCVVLNANILIDEIGHTEAMLSGSRAWAQSHDFSCQANSAKELVLARAQILVKCEVHTEFFSLTLSAPMADLATAKSLLASLAGAQGQVGHLISQCQINVMERDNGEAPCGSVSRQPNPSTAVKVWLNGRAHVLETDLLHHDDFVVYQLSVSRREPERIGRLAQRLLEIETYRNLAYLAVPMLHTLGPQVGELDRAIDKIAEESTSDLSPEHEARILSSLTGLSAQLQSIGSKAEFRFSAAIAYARIVEERLDELREERIEGHQRLSVAVQRRLRPNIRSCIALQARIDRVSHRVSNITELLRTRVELTLQEQNALVLKSIDKRTKDQLRLQQVVEGLSVAAISYYVISILIYFMQGLEAVAEIDFYEVALTAIVPVIFIAIFVISRRLRKKHLD